MKELMKEGSRSSAEIRAAVLKGGIWPSVESGATRHCQLATQMLITTKRGGGQRLWEQKWRALLVPLGSGSEAPPRPHLPPKGI